MTVPDHSVIKMTKRALVQAVASKISNYRKGSIPRIDTDHVHAWIRQFEDEVRDPILRELDHVLGKTYLSRTAVKSFLKELATLDDLTSGKHKTFWRKATILNNQRAGSSQKELLALFDDILDEEHGICLKDCGDDDGVAIYIDDVVFTGGHVRGDLIDWIERSAPRKAVIHIIVMAYHLGGQHFAGNKIAEAAEKAGKKIELRWWSIQKIEDRKYYINNSDVLRPVRIPDHRLTQEYAAKLKAQGYAPVLRKPGSVGPAQFFSSDEGRHLLEQQFLIAGTEIREMCPLLNEYQRPLGNMVLRTLGFGALIVTFRNCANNCPLAFWAGDPWIPLFPRKTNE
ncbi:MAG: hypothetical protein JST79_18545 [Acidobacteria bacterium]|nr:hypothetical protein [Acidobacteriota bacterium]